MPPIPDLSDYISRHDSYQQYISLAIVLAGIFAVGIGRLPGRGVRLPRRFQLWHIVLIGGLIRWPLMDQDYWYDETFTSAITSLGWGRMWTVIQGDVHPPLYYGLVKLTTLIFGDGDVAMRLPAFASGLALIVVMKRIGTIHGGKTVGRWAALITAILPATAYYSTEARYPAFLALMLATAYLGIQRRSNGLTALPLTVAALTHVNGWFYVAALGLAFVWRKRSLSSLLAMTVPAGTMTAWLPIALQQSADVADGFWLQQSTVSRFLVDMTVTTRFPDANLTALLIVVAAALGIIAVAVWKWRRRVSWLWLVLVAGIPAIQWGVGAAWEPIYLERTLMFSALLLIVPVAVWLDRHGSKLWATVGMMLIGAALVMIVISDRSMVDDVFAACGDANVVYAGNTYSAIQASHYTDAVVLTAINGNSTAQSLPDAARRSLWLVLLEPRPPAGACVVAQVDAFTSPQQLAHLEAMTDVRRKIVEVNEYAYWIVELKRN